MKKTASGFHYALALLLGMVTIGFVEKKEGKARPPMTLSEYGFFEGNIAEQIPAEHVLSYELTTPLFSDYARKLRFVRLPEGKTVTYNEKEVFNFPVGTQIVKTFYYPHDATQPERGRKLIETRVLTHEEDGWTALPYVWNEAQTDASLEVAGETLEVSYVHDDGKKKKFSYTVPNVNQCKGCHSFKGEMMPIGPSARQLNGDFAYGHGSANQLQHWAELGKLKGLPEDLSTVPQIARWDDPEAPLAERARAWLDINCAHCHRAEGPASTSGFFLDIHQTDPAVLGVMKVPVAAGRGAGNLRYDILPGKPKKSILYYRINSDDPGIMMPELGRSLIHEEGVALIKEWIEEME
jgi:uncharacterized repeat protein (TIGR03806 family)